MSIFKAIILGFVQGLTEFLPVSSSGHLTLFQQIFGIEEPTLGFDVFLHVATLIPVIFVFWGDIWALLKKPFQKTTYLLIVGILPLVVIALFFKDFIDAFFQNGMFLGVNFLITGLILMLADSRKGGTKRVEDMSYTDALLVGTMQGFAVLPAISRSGSTICGSLFCGLTRSDAARFSFLLSIPAIVGSFVFELKDVILGDAVFFSLGFVPMMAGFFAAMLSGFFAIKVMLRVINNNKLSVFAYYVVAIGVLVILDQNIFHVFF